MTTDIKFAAILGFMGQQRDRFQVFGPPYTLEEKVERTAQVERCGAVELVYPGELDDIAEIKRLLEKYELEASTVNVNIKTDEMFHQGALTSPKPAVRAHAIEYLKHGMDLAPEMGTDTVTCCPLGDGTEYAFQMDYTDAWGWFVDGIREVASHRSDVKLSLEYKKNETRAQGGHHPRPLHGVAPRHDGHERIAFDPTDDGQTGACIAAGQLDHGLTRS